MSYKLYDAEIEYLETQGHCNIITDCVPSGSNIAIASKFMFIGYVNSTQWVPWYISYVNEDTQTFRIARVYANNTVIMINNGANAGGSIYDAQFNVSANGIYEIETKGQRVTVNGVTKTNRAASSSLNTAKMRIMNANFKGRCYYFKIEDDNTLLLDCIPVRVGNVGYMYDRVSGQLFGNAGTGSFVLGPDVSYDVPEANEVAFLESWGNQYIDTGIKPSTDTKIELKCLYCKSGVGLTNYGALIGADDRANAYTLTHSDMANFTFGESVSKDFANPQTRLLTFDSTESSQSMKVYDEGGSLVTTLTCLKGIFEISQNLYLFAVNRNGTPVYGSNRILYCKIYDGDTLVRDYVPVEYNGIGYMYDKVSGLFFDNKGTGNFLFGSIAKACARSYTRRQLMADTVLPKPYISEGLVFHLDGADFDGTTWHSRVGNYIATPHGNITKTSDGGVQFNGGTNIVRYCAVSPGITVKNNVGTIEVCAYRTQKNTGRYSEQIVDWGTINMISYHVLAGRLAVATANYPNLPSPRAPIDYNIGKFTHSINNERQVFNGLLKELGTSVDSGRSNNTIGGRPNNGAWNFIGIIYQIRIYNRHLTEEEMKWNQEQDRKKYGIQF